MVVVERQIMNNPNLQPREAHIINQSQAEKFISRESNIVPLEKRKRQCGDDRSQEGGLSIFGGDAITTQIITGMGMQPEDSVNLVIDINKTRGQNTYIHTDDTATDASDDTGCGQLKKPSLTENEILYKPEGKSGLSTENAKRIIIQFNQKAKDDPEHVVVQTLKGKHLAGAVFINTGKKNSIRHDDGTDSGFVVDAVANEEYLKDMFSEIVKRHPEYKGREKEFMDMYSHLTGVTAALLANGLPVYEINVDNPLNVQIKSKGVMGQKAG